MKKRIYGYLLIFLLMLLISAIPLIPNFSKNVGKYEVNEEVNLSFLKNEKAKFIILYFGYVGCQTVCSPRLQEIESIYNDYPNKKDLQVIFINILEDVDINVTNSFTKYFGENFKGINIEKKELFEVTSKLNFYFSKGFSDITEINHTSFLYLFKKIKNGYILKSFYITTPYNKKLILRDLIEYNKS